jgi:predicted RNase H-like nuclease (RuvC/YqgF family)
MEDVKAFNAIQANLDSIKQKEQMISDISSETNPELKLTKEDQINRDIDAIYNLLIKNRAIVTKLQNQLKNAGLKNAELEKMIANLNYQIQSKDAEISLLKEELAGKNVQIRDLEANLEQKEALNRERAAQIEAKVLELNTVYYIIGTRKNLQEQQIVTKEGGFIGLGKTSKVNENFDKSLFTKADLRELHALPVFSKKAQLLSIHPAGSYSFGDDGAKTIDSLRIVHPDDFWSASKYLVLLID